MQTWKLVLTFAFCLFLRVANADETVSDASTVDAVIAADQKATVVQPATPVAETQAKPASGIQNNITVNAPSAAAPVNATPVAPVAMKNSDDVSSVMGARGGMEASTAKFSIISMAGGSDYSGAWGQHVTNAYSLGLGLEISTGSALAFEIEGTHGKYNTQYLATTGRSYNHDFSQYSIGANAKLYVIRGVINPYLGGGATALYYENMDRGALNPLNRYNQWVGAGQLLAGTDVEVSNQIAVGVRGAWLLPLLNKPTVIDNGTYAARGFEDASLMSASQFRILGTARISF